MTEEIERRRALRTAGLIGIGAGVGPLVTGAPAAAEPGAAGAPRTTEIPVGGGKVFPKESLVVTQPTEGDFRGFSATCTHSGCTVGAVVDGLIHCCCHNSQFRIADGSVKGGPALLPLPPEPIEVKNGRIRRTGKK